jgi:hypothetical protein
MGVRPGRPGGEEASEFVAFSDAQLAAAAAASGIVMTTPKARFGFEFEQVAASVAFGIFILSLVVMEFSSLHLLTEPG